MSARDCKCDDCQRSYGPRGGPHEGHDAVCPTCDGHPGHVPCPDCEMTSVEDEGCDEATNPSSGWRAPERPAHRIPRRCRQRDYTAEAAGY